MEKGDSEPQIYNAEKKNEITNAEETVTKKQQH